MFMLHFKSFPWSVPALSAVRFVWNILYLKYSYLENFFTLNKYKFRDSLTTFRDFSWLWLGIKKYNIFLSVAFYQTVRRMKKLNLTRVVNSLTDAGRKIAMDRGGNTELSFYLLLAPPTGQDKLTCTWQAATRSCRTCPTPGTTSRRCAWSPSTSLGWPASPVSEILKAHLGNFTLFTDWEDAITAW